MFMKGTKVSKMLCLGMSAMRAFSGVPQTNVYADDTAIQSEVYGDFTYSVLADGTIEISGYSGSDTKLKLPSEIAGRKMTSIGNFAFAECSNLISNEIYDVNI